MKVLFQKKGKCFFSFSGELMSKLFYFFAFEQSSRFKTSSLTLEDLIKTWCLLSQGSQGKVKNSVFLKKSGNLDKSQGKVREIFESSKF